MKEKFIQFLKDNNFYEGWIEGYKLDNEIYKDEVPLERFFNDIPPHLWLYSGPGILAFLSPELGEEHERKREEWRKRWLGIYMDLDEK